MLESAWVFGVPLFMETAAYIGGRLPTQLLKASWFLSSVVKLES